jgi:hypothetical protein
MRQTGSSTKNNKECNAPSGPLEDRRGESFLALEKKDMTIIMTEIHVILISMAHLADCLQYLREGKKSGNYQQIVKSK